MHADASVGAHADYSYSRAVIGIYRQKVSHGYRNAEADALTWSE